VSEAGATARDHCGRHRVAVTGLGAVVPAGATVDEMWARLVSGRSCAARIERFDPAALPVPIACEVTDFDPTAYVTPKEARRLDRVAQLAFAAAADACADAGSPAVETDRAGVVAGVGIGGLITLEQQIGTLLDKGPSRVSPFLVPMMMPNAASALVSMQLGWTGPNITVATACAAGANAIGDAAELIRHGVADVVIGLGAEACITPVCLSAFAQMTALSRRIDDPAAASRPFDRDRDGFVIGEGAAALVLERYDLAVARGATVHAELIGYGRNADAHHVTAPAPGGVGMARCMELALADADLAASEIAHVNAHGTSTPLNDAAEASAIQRVFGDGVVVTSTKGVTGHLIGAAGATEAVAGIIAMNRCEVPPTANLETLDPEIHLDVVRDSPRAVARGPVLSNSFGFGGHNATLIFAPA
jgi:3-oxoacyl-[acyl-carrier-protein] synthase II